MRVALVILAAAGLAGCSSTSSTVSYHNMSYGYPGIERDVVIRNDSGGYVAAYVMQKAQIERSGRKVRITGRCDSACTMYLGLPKSQVCIEPGAYFRFHAPLARSQGTKRAATRLLYAAYPAWVESWISAKGGLSTTLKTMDYSYASKFLPTCSRVA